MVDFRWQTTGGILLDGSGDIAITSASTMESLTDMVRTRLKTTLEGWKLYRIGANLIARIGENMLDPELDARIKQQVTTSLGAYLPRGSFQVETLADGEAMHVLVYVRGSLVAQALLSGQSVTVQ